MDIKLTANDILEKEFKKSVKGYHVDQVDKFLDEIMEDYQKFEAALAELQQENMRLQEQLSARPRRVEPEVKPVQQAVGTTNYDILKRLANLERHVFGDKLSD
ncbi:MAG: cell division regulator GpsB [Lysinibacillus sp.]